jgi:hypothetical protein
MTLGQGTGTAKREPTSEELHFLKNHLTIIFDKENNRVSIGFAYGCPDPQCPGSGIQPMVAFYACPKQPCPPLIP